MYIVNHLRWFNSGLIVVYSGLLNLRWFTVVYGGLYLVWWFNGTSGLMEPKVTVSYHETTTLKMFLYILQQ